MLKSGRGAARQGRSRREANTVAKNAVQFTGDRQLRRFGIPDEATATISELMSDQPIKAHRDYSAAKSGDPAAAARLVRDLIKPETLDAARERFGAGAI